jgi:hypothetical protein
MYRCENKPRQRLAKNMTNTEVKNAIFSNKNFSISYEIDQTYGYSLTTYFYHNGSYRKRYAPASNWLYCGVCGQPHPFSCDCDDQILNDFWISTNLSPFQYGKTESLLTFEKINKSLITIFSKKLKKA